MKVYKRRRTLKRKSGWIFLAVFSALTRGSLKTPESPTCAVQTPVEIGSQSVVRCHFFSPLAEGDGFSVELHSPRATSDTTPGTKSTVSIVLDCYMDRCIIAKGYEWSWENNPNLTVQVTITQAAAAHAGRYVCKKTPDPLGGHTGCELNVKKKGSRKLRTRCDTTSPVFEGSLSAVSCHFTEDPRTHKNYFNVLRYDYGDNNRMPEPVLECYWPAGLSELSCNAADGYIFDTTTVRKNINLLIPNTTKSHQGRYVCEDALSLPYNMKECELTVKGNTVSCSAPAAREEEEAVITCHMNSDLNRTKDAFSVFRKDKAIARCMWVENPTDKLQCDTEPGYSVRLADRTDAVAVLIEAARALHSGTYRCSPFDPHNRITVKTCQLNVTGQDRGAEQQKKYQGWMIVLTVVAIVIAGLLLVTAFRYMISKRTLQETPSSHPSQQPLRIAS